MTIPICSSQGYSIVYLTKGEGDVNPWNFDIMASLEEDYSTSRTSAATRKKKVRKMMKRKGITSLDLLFRKSAQEITCKSREICVYRKSEQSHLMPLTVV